MPKRSNDFQTLITLIEKQLASKDVYVEESKLVKEINSDEEREIDIYIEAQINGHLIRMAVECRNHKRKAGKEWIEQLIGKYQALPIDKVIAVSKTGFFKTAFDRANQSNIDLLSLKDACEEDWIKYVNNLKVIVVNLVRFLPFQFEFDLSQPISEKNIHKIKAFDKPNNTWRSLPSHSLSLIAETKNHTTLQDLLTKNFNDKTNQFKNGSNLIKVKSNLKNKFLIKDDSSNESLVQSITYHFKCEVSKSSIPVSKFTYNNAQVATIIKDLSNMKLIMTISESIEKPPTLAVVMEFKNSSGKNIKKEIITKPIPTFDGVINFTKFELVNVSHYLTS